MINTTTQTNEKKAKITRQREDAIQDALYQMEQEKVSPSAELSRTAERKSLDDAYFSGRRIFGEIEQKIRQVAPQGSSETMLEALKSYVLQNIEPKSQNHADLANCLYTMGKNASEAGTSFFTWKSREAMALSETYGIPIPEKAMEFIWDIFKCHRQDEDLYLVSELKKDTDKLIPILLAGHESKRGIATYQKALKTLLEKIIDPDKAEVKLTRSELDSLKRNYCTHDWTVRKYIGPLRESKNSLTRENEILEEMNSPIDEERRPAEWTLMHRNDRELYDSENEKDIKIATYNSKNSALELKGGNE